MKLILLFILCTPFAHAWEVKKIENTMFLTDDTLKVREKVVAAKEAKDLFTKSLSESVILVRYPENIGGTTSVDKTYNCAGVNSKTGKVIFKDEICLVERATAEGTKVIKEAKFESKNNKINYTFEELQEEF